MGQVVAAFWIDAFLLLALGVLVMEGSPLFDSTIAKLQIGMSRGEVIKIAGVPSIVEEYEDHGSKHWWTYSSFCWTVIYLDFGPDGRLERIFVDR